MTNYILVTGGAGFIGQRLCKQLLDDGHHVICFDRSESPIVHDHVTNIIGDVREALMLKYVADTFNVTHVYHLASPASPVTFSVMPVFVLTTNVMGTANVMEIFGKLGARILITSTSEVYGDPEIHPQEETYWGNVNPIGPRACYDEGKRAAEALCVSYHSQFGVDYCITRLFNVYGPGMEDYDGRAVPSFIRAAIDGRDLTIFGQGLQTRSFVYIDDVVIALIRLMGTSLNGPYNIGLPTETSIVDLARTIISLVHSNSKIIHDTSRVDDPARRRPDVNKMFHDTGWQASTDIMTGLERTIQSVKLLDLLRQPKLP
jgi:nucleoside-diphosphate-sugar epimerase